MARLNITGSEREQAIAWFRSGRDGKAGLHQLAARCNAGSGRTRSRDALALMCLESFVAIAGVQPDTAANRTVHFLASLIGCEAATTQREQRAEHQREQQREELNKAARSTLGVTADADMEEIKRAYRQLASRYHPDKLPANASEDEREFAVRRSIEVRSAWEFLLDRGSEAQGNKDAA